MDKIWEETLARIDKLELQIKNIENFIVPGVNDKPKPPKPKPKTK